MYEKCLYMYEKLIIDVVDNSELIIVKKTMNATA